MAHHDAAPLAEAYRIGLIKAVAQIVVSIRIRRMGAETNAYSHHNYGSYGQEDTTHVSLLSVKRLEGLD